MPYSRIHQPEDVKKDSYPTPATSDIKFPRPAAIGEANFTIQHKSSIINTLENYRRMINAQVTNGRTVAKITSSKNVFELFDSTIIQEFHELNLHALPPQSP